jgi:AcrR family transcriptional regulator
MMSQHQSELYVVETSVKNPVLVAKRRADIIDAAVKIFTKKGYHTATTKEIADLAGLNVGTMFQYVKTKQDILYLVCCHIHSLIEDALLASSAKDTDPKNIIFEDVIALYTIMDKVSDYVVLMYQETFSLEKSARISFLSREQSLCTYFEKQIQIGIDAGLFNVNPNSIPLIAEDILTNAQMWAFRRWSLSKKFTLETYINTRIEFLKSVLF